jgi:uncharacterized protein (TIGR02145 family)
MKKNFLIMMIMLLCSGFAFAQINTVRGFVPGAGTGAGNNDQTYAVFGQMFGDIDFTAANPYEVAEGLAQAQLVADTVEAVVGCGDSLTIGEFHLSAAAIQQIVDEFTAAPTRPRDTFLTIQHPNIAIYNYDKLLVLHLFVCPCTIKDEDAEPHTYDVIAIDNLCWTKSNMRSTTTCAGTTVETMSYTSEIVNSLDEETFGLLYTWENATKDSKCDSIYLTGICPCGWHLPTAEEVDTILKINTDALRTAEGNYWVVAENITNLTKFSAQPGGYYKGLAERFEGYHSEADFWFADNDTTCDPNYFQILYYCNLPKQEYRSVDTDAMSVRCVLDMIYDYKNKNEEEEEECLSCPEFGDFSFNPDLSQFEMFIQGYVPCTFSSITIQLDNENPTDCKSYIIQSDDLYKLVYPVDTTPSHCVVRFTYIADAAEECDITDGALEINWDAR